MVCLVHVSINNRRPPTKTYVFPYARLLFVRRACLEQIDVLVSNIHRRAPIKTHVFPHACLFYCTDPRAGEDALLLTHNHFNVRVDFVL